MINNIKGFLNQECIMDQLNLNTRLTSMRSSSAILKSVLPDIASPEPGAYPHATNPNFRESDTFVANIARLVMDMRTSEAAKKATVPAAAVPKAEPGKTITLNQANVAKLYGGTGDDKVTVTANKVDYVSTGSGNDSIVVKAKGDDAVTEGIAAIDSGSVTRVAGGDGDDSILVEAEQLAHDIGGGNGNDTVLVAANYASKISGGNGDDVVKIVAHSVDSVAGNVGDDDIEIEATIEKGIDGEWKLGSRQGDVSNITSDVGNDKIVIRAENSVYDIDSGSGDDAVSITSNELRNLKTGSGNDQVVVNAQGIFQVDTGAGSDTLMLSAKEVSGISTSYGDDSLLINAGRVANINTGSGNDTVIIKSDEGINELNTGDGDDLISVDTNKIMSPEEYSDSRRIKPVISNINGGAGSDKITLLSDNLVTDVNGGGGNDIIDISAAKIYDISGGKGDDTLNLSLVSPDSNVLFENASIEDFDTNGKYADFEKVKLQPIRVRFAEGDGNDTINTTDDLEIMRYSADGTRELGLEGAKLEKLGTDKYRLTFAKSNDSITINCFEPGRTPGFYQPRIEGNKILLAPPFNP